MRQTKKFFLSLWASFLSFYHPPDDLENQNFEKKWKCLEILSFHKYMCTINEDHMILYGSWNIRCDRQTKLVILDQFMPFYPLKPEKSKFWKNKKTRMIICYTAPEIWCVTDAILTFYFRLVLDHFLPFYPLKPEKSKLKQKTKKNTHDHMLHCSWDMMCDACNSNFLF